MKNSINTFIHQTLAFTPESMFYSELIQPEAEQVINKFKNNLKSGEKKMKQLFNTSKALVFTAIFMLFVNAVFGQYQQRSYDTKCGNVSGSEFGKSIITTLDSGYAIAGFDNLVNCGIGSADWMFLKLRPSGSHQSVKLYGTIFDDKCFSTVQVSDSGYLLAGYMTEGSRTGATLMKLNKAGVKIACRQIDDTLHSVYNQVVRDPVNTSAYCGFLEKYFTLYDTKRKKVLVSQYNSNPKRLWAFRYDSYTLEGAECLSTDIAVSICYQPNPSTSPKSYGVAVRTNRLSRSNGWDIMVMKLNYGGSVVWNRTYKILSNIDYPSAVPTKIIPMDDGGFTVVGYTNANNNQSDIIVLRIDMNGTLIWSQTYGSPDGQEFGHSIVEDNGCFVITGSGQGVVGNPDALLMKIPTAGGPPFWTKIWDTGNNGGETGYDLVNSTFSAADGYAITGETSRGVQSFNPFLWRADDNGQITGRDCQDSVFFQSINSNHLVDSVILRPEIVKCKMFIPVEEDPSLITNIHCVSALASPNQGEENLDNGLTGVNELTQMKSYSLKQNFPNPFNPVTKIQYEIPLDGFVSMKVFDMTGKEVMSLVNEMKPQGRYEVEFNGEKLSSGVYYYKLVSGNFTEIKKMMLLK